MLIQSTFRKLYQWTAQQPDKLFYDNPIKASGCTTLGKQTMKYGEWLFIYATDSLRTFHNSTYIRCTSPFIGDSERFG